MPRSNPTGGKGSEKDPSRRAHVSYRMRDNSVFIRVRIDEAIALSETLNLITRSRIPNPERWALLADITHDLDAKLDDILRKDPR